MPTFQGRMLFCVRVGLAVGLGCLWMFAHDTAKLFNTGILIPFATVRVHTHYSPSSACTHTVVRSPLLAVSHNPDERVPFVTFSLARVAFARLHAVARALVQSRVT